MDSKNEYNTVKQICELAVSECKNFLYFQPKFNSEIEFSLRIVTEELDMSFNEAVIFVAEKSYEEYLNISCEVLMEKSVKCKR